MNRLFTFALCGFCALSVHGEMLYLMNGDRIQGKALGLEGTSLLWKSPRQETPLLVPVAYIRSMELNNPDELPLPQKSVRLEFVNGDLFHADSLQSTGEELQVLRDAHKRTARMQMVRALYFQPPGHLVLMGTDSADAWKESPARTEPGRERSGSRAPSRYALSRQMPDFPDLFSVQVQLKMEDETPNVRIALFAEKEDPANPAALHVHFSSTGLTLSQIFAGNNQRLFRHRLNLHQLNIQELTFTLYVDRIQGELHLQLHDLALMHKIEVDNALKGRLSAASWMHFTSFRGTESLQEALIMKWDGRLPDPAPKTVPSGKVRLEFWQGEPLNGKLLALDEERVLIQRKDAPPREIPLSEIRSMTFGRAPEIRPRRSSRDIRIVHRRYGDELTLAFMGMNETEMRGHSENWMEPLHFPLADLERMQMNVHSILRTGEASQKYSLQILPHNLQLRSESR